MRREMLEDVHHAFRRRFQQHTLLAGGEVHGHQIPGGDHPAGDIGVRVVHAHHIAAPGAVGVTWSHRAEILDHFAQLRIVDVQADPVVPRPCSIDPPVRPGHERTNLAAKTRHDLAPLLNGVRRRIVHEQVHAPGLSRRAGDVVFAVEPQCPARQVKLVTIRQTLLLHLARAKVDGIQPRRPVVLLEVDLQHVPALAVGVRHHPSLPDVHAAGRLAQRLRLQDRTHVREPPSTPAARQHARALRQRPDLSQESATLPTMKRRLCSLFIPFHCRNVLGHQELTRARRRTGPRARSQSAPPGNPAAE